MSSDPYVENDTIILPVLKDGVTRLGDLWNCHESKYAGENLFEHPLDGDYITASHIQDDEFKLIHCNCTSDKFKTINIGGEISLELLAGLINAKGSTNYQSDEKDIKNREKLICHYRKGLFSVDALPRAKDLLDISIVGKILKKSLKATHFVRRVILGAEVKADILVTQDEESSKTNIKGDFLDKIVYGPINASSKASLGFLDSENNTNFKKEINVDSIPVMRANPKSVEEMFEFIEKMNTAVDKHKYFPEKGENIIGVPIRFVLVPVKQFIIFNAERLYLRLSDKLVNNFNEMLFRVHDIRVPGYISKKVLEMNSNLALLLFDNQSKLSQEIREYEKDLCEIGNKYFEESSKTLKNYKIKKADVGDLLRIIVRFQEVCNSFKVYEKIVGFKEEGEGQLH